jgi:hypothetical protein
MKYQEYLIILLMPLLISSLIIPPHLGLDEDMNHGLDTYSGFEEPFPFEDPSKSAALVEGSMTTRSYSPENPVLGDSGWDEDGEKVDLFPSPTKKSQAPTVPPVPVSEPLSDIPAEPTTLNVPVIISPATVVIPLGTARFTGFTSACQVDINRGTCRCINFVHPTPIVSDSILYFTKVVTSSSFPPCLRLVS